MFIHGMECEESQQAGLYLQTYYYEEQGNRSVCEGKVQLTTVELI